MLHTATAPAPPTSTSAVLELLLFTTDASLVREATSAGIDGFIVDWERRGKARRQAGFDTQINADTVDDLLAVRAATDAKVLCRVNGHGPWTAHEVEQAVAAGADEVLLPMVRATDEVDRTLEAARGRCGVGILVETQDGLDVVQDLAARPLSRVYVGLNDLRIDRRSSSLFAPLVDGTAQAVRDAAGSVPFGIAGLTLPHLGRPVPTRLLAAELVRLAARFTFLRRSFLADTAGRPLAPAVAAIRDALEELASRTPDQVVRDAQALLEAVHPARASMSA